MVQWLRLCSPDTGGLGLIPGQETKIPLASEQLLVAQMVKSLPAMWEAQLLPLVWKDLLEKEMATHSSIPAWKTP